MFLSSSSEGNTRVKSLSKGSLCLSEPACVHTAAAPAELWIDASSLGFQCRAPPPTPREPKQVYVMNNVHLLPVFRPVAKPVPWKWEDKLAKRLAPSSCLKDITWNSVEFYLVASHSPQQSRPHTRHALPLGCVLLCKVVKRWPAWKSENQRKETACWGILAHI